MSNLLNISTKRIKQIGIDVEKITDENIGDIAFEAMKKVKEWMILTKSSNFPSTKSLIEYQKDLALIYREIKRNIIIPYQISNDEREKQKLQERVPKLEEIIKIYSWCIEKRQYPYVKSMEKMLAWLENNHKDRLPSTTSPNETERKIRIDYENAKGQIVKKYLALSEEEKKQFEIAHPEVKRVIELYNKIKERNVDTKSIITMKKIYDWIYLKGNKRIPRRSSKEKEEQKLAGNYVNILVLKIYPYLRLDETEKAKYLEEHKDLLTIMQMMLKITKQYGNKHEQVLAEKISDEIVSMGLDEQKEQNRKEVKKKSKSEKESRLEELIKESNNLDNVIKKARELKAQLEKEIGNIRGK